MALGALAVSLLTLLGTAAPDPPEPRGELTIYRAPTRIGIVAKRELLDELGRPVETTYYTRKRGTDGAPLTEQSLAVQSFVKRSYDAEGRLAFQNQFAPDGRPISAGQIRYDSTGTKRAELATWFTSRGPRSVEAWYDAPGRTTEIQCDESGRILEITGPIPPDLDLPGGWGPERNGLSLRLVASRDRGPLSQISLILSLRNRGEAEATRGLTVDPLAPLEIRDASGHLVPASTQPSGAGAAPCPDTAAPGLGRREIAHVRECMLGEVWTSLAPGPYTAVARHCMPGGEEPLVSNVVAFTVEHGL